MGRKLIVAGALAAALAGALFFLLGDGDSPRSIDRTPTEDPATTAGTPIDPIGPDGLGTDEEPVASETGEIDLGGGPGGLHGTVRDPEGAVAPGAAVTLLRSRLPVEVEEEGGLSIFRVIEFSGWGARAMREIAEAEAFPFRREIREGLVAVASVRTDDAGHYRFLGIPTGRYLISAGTPTSLVTPTPSIRNVEDEEQRVDIALIESGGLTGSVLSTDGAPIPGAIVRLRGEVVSFEGGMETTFIGRDELLLYLLNPVMGRMSTDEFGNFRFTGLPPLPYQVFVEASPWAATDERHAVPESGSIEIVLEEGGALEGVVIDPVGTPVAGAEVALAIDGRAAWGADALRPMPGAVTDADGRFRLEGLAPENYRIDVRMDGFRPGSAAGLNVARGETRAVELVLEPGARLEGIVLDGEGAPVPRVEVEPRGNRRARGPSVQTGPDGTFRIDTLEEGTYTLRFSLDGWLDQEVEATTDGPPIQVVLEPGPYVRARVVDAEGRPVARARVQTDNDWTQSVRAETAADGTFSLQLSRDGGLTLVVRARGFAAGRIEVPEGGGDLGELVLAEAARIEGFVLDPEGLAISGARVVASLQGERGPGRFAARSTTAWSDSDGAFSIEVDDPVGEYALVANFPLLLPSPEERIVLDGRGVSGVVLSLRWGGSIFGEVVGGENVPLDGATIEVRRSDDNARWRGGRRTGRSNGDGEYQVAGLEAGTYELRVSAPGHAQTVVPDLVLGQDEARRYDVRLERESILLGTVIDETGIPIDRARIGAREENGARRNTSSDPAGAFVIDRLGRGALTVTAEAPGFLRTRLRDIYAEDGPLDVVLRVAHEIPGLVLDAGTGDPVVRARVRVVRVVEGEQRANAGNQWGRTDDEGRFVVRDLELGEYRIQVTASGYIPLWLEEPVEVPFPDRVGELVIALQPGVRVRGTVFDPVGRPLANARARAYRLPDDPNAAPSTDARRRRSASQARTDEDGRFTLQGMDEGRYEIVISHDEYLPRTETATMRLDQAEPILSVALERGAEITGRVYTEGGMLQSSGSVFLGGADRRRVSVEEDGTFRIAGLPAGAFSLEYREGRQRMEGAPAASVELSEQERRSIDLRP